MRVKERAKERSESETERQRDDIIRVSTHTRVFNPARKTDRRTDRHTDSKSDGWVKRGTDRRTRCLINFK